MSVKNKNGTTLVELLVSILIASILILIIGVISEISLGSYNKLKKQGDIFADVTYGLKYMQKKVREATSLSSAVAASPWISSQVVINTGRFGIDQTTTSGVTTKNFAYLPTSGPREVIFSVNNSDTLNMSIDSIVTNKSVKMTISGKKDKIPFNLTTNILKRAQ